MNSTTDAQFTLADLRQRAGLSQSEVARRMGVNRPRVGQIERDFPSVRFDTVDKYIRALGMHSDFADATGFSVRADRIDPHPEGKRDHGYRKRPERASEE